MAQDKDSCCEEKKGMRCGAAGGGVYGLAFLGALVYYIQNAGSFGEGVIGFFKALLWPAFLIYKLLEYLKM